MVEKGSTAMGESQGLQLRSHGFRSGRNLPLKKAWFGRMDNVDFLNVDNLSAEEVGQKIKEWVDYWMKQDM